MATNARLCVHILRNKLLSFCCSQFPASCSLSCICISPAACICAPLSAGEFSTPVGALIEQATSESLVNTDWALNLQICDEVSMHFLITPVARCFRLLASNAIFPGSRLVCEVERPCSQVAICRIPERSRCTMFGVLAAAGRQVIAACVNLPSCHRKRVCTEDCSSIFFWSLALFY